MKEKKQDNMDIVKLLFQSTMMAFGGMLFPVLYLFFPALFLRETSKQGTIRVMLIFLSVICLVGAVFGPTQGFVMLTLFGPLILVLDYCMRTNRNVGITMIVATLIFLFSIVFNIYMSGSLVQIQKGTLFQEVLNFQKEVLKETQFSKIEVDRFLSQMRESLLFIQTIIPGLVLLSSLAIVYVSYSMTGKARMMRGEKIVAPAPFLFVRLPNNLMLTAFIFSILLVFASQFLNLEIEALTYNIIFVVSGLLFFQGLAVLNFFLFRLVPMGVFRGIFIGILLILPFVQIFLVFIGFLDQWLNFRRIRQ